jgi:PGF-pre-PGF domain-containing protein
MMMNKLMLALVLMAALLLLPSPALAAITCTGTDSTKSIAVGEQGDITVSCSGIGESQTVTVSAAGYSGSCLEAKDTIPFQLTQSSPSVQITWEATSMACENNADDRTITWSFSATGESISSQNTIVTITSPLSVTAAFLNAPYSVTAGSSVTVSLEVSTGATVDISDVDADLSGSSSAIYGLGKLADWEDNTIYSSGSQKTIQKSWTFNAPSATGSYSVSVVVTSQNAGGDTASTTLVVTSGGGGDDGETPGGGSPGGSGGTPSASAKATKQWQNMNADEDATMEINNSNIGFTKLRIRVRNQVESVTMEVESLGSRPSDVTAPSGNAYQYVNVTPTGLNDSSIESATITFRVTKEWVTQNQIDVSTMSLERWQNNAWESLTTRAAGADSEHYSFEADTPGFSYFVITGQQLAEQPDVCNNDGFCDAGEDNDNCPNDCEPGEVGGCAAGAKQCVGMVLQECVGGEWTDLETCGIGCMQGACLEPIEIDTNTLIIIVVIVVAAVVIVVVVRMRKKKPSGPPKSAEIPVISKPEGISESSSSE